MSDNNIENMDTDSKPPVDCDSWCRTRNGVEAKYKFVWTIERFSQRQEKNTESLYSDIFTIQGPGNMKTQWKIRLFPKGLRPEASEYLAVSLCNETGAEVNAGFELSILDSNETNQYSLKAIKQFASKTSNTGKAWGNGLIALSRLQSQSSELLQNDSLTIVCNVTIFGPEETVTISKQTEADYHVQKLEGLSQDFENLFSNKEMCDVQVHCKDQVYDCHQLILSARSPVFRAMFQAEMEEKQTRKVEIQDFNPPTMSALLTFIYTGKTPTLEEHAEDLLMAAEKYQIDQLKSLCVKKLCSNIEVKNCLNYLVIGDLYRAGNLKKASLKYITRNKGSVFKSKDWVECLKDHPTIMAEVINAFARTGGGGGDN